MYRLPACRARPSQGFLLRQEPDIGQILVEMMARTDRAPGGLRSKVVPPLAVTRQVCQRPAHPDERIAALTHTEARVQRLQTVPNIGPGPRCSSRWRSTTSSLPVRARGRGLLLLGF